MWGRPDDHHSHAARHVAHHAARQHHRQGDPRHQGDLDRRRDVERLGAELDAHRCRWVRPLGARSSRRPWRGAARWDAGGQRRSVGALARSLHSSGDEVSYLA